MTATQETDEITALFNLPCVDESNPFRPSRSVIVQGVLASDEFYRVRDLPRRSETIEPEIVEALTQFCKTDQHREWDRIRAMTPPPANWQELLPEGRIASVLKPEKPISLREIQARGIKDAYEVGAGTYNAGGYGLFAPIGVGHGKFLLSVLLCVVIEAARARAGQPRGRWLLLVPAALLPQTRGELAKMRRHLSMPDLWPNDKGGPCIRVESYDQLSRDRGAVSWLESYAPTDIVCDEAHKLKGARSARGKKFVRYFRDRAKAKLRTCLYGMSGSFARKALRDFWHLLHMCLPSLAPVPRRFRETEAWGQALDDKVDNNMRIAPGALLHFVDAADLEQFSPGWGARPKGEQLGYYGETPEKQAALLALVRRGWQRRFRETPGVVGTEESAIGASLIIAERKPPPIPAVVTEAFHTLRTTWQTPNGDEIDGGVSMWRHACELSSGFWYQWVPGAPPEWLAARQDWNRYVRYVLTNNRQKLDSPLQVWQATERGDLSEAFGPGLEFMEAWRDVRDTFKPRSEPQWLDRWLVNDVLSWFAEQKDDDKKPLPGIAWVLHSAVGEAITEASEGRIPFFGGGPEASKAIAEWRGHCVASIPAHGTGKNLQHYARALVVHPPAGGDTWEQLLGRLHRFGQEADEVRFDVYLHALELRRAFDTARSSATFIQDLTKQPQKIMYANVMIEPAENITALASAGDPLWRK